MIGGSSIRLPGFRSERSEGVAALLAMSAGYVDGYGVLTYGTFLSFMSGNTTIAGYRLGQGNVAAAVPSIIAIAGFVCGATIGSAITLARGRQSRGLDLAAVAVLQGVVVLTAYTGALTDHFRIATASVGMGMMNPALTRVGAQPISLTFVTGTLRTIGDHLAHALTRAHPPDARDARDTYRRRVAELAGIWGAFLIGALLAGIATPRLGAWTLLPSAAGLLALSCSIAR